MPDKTLGAYERTTPDPDATMGEVLARLRAQMKRLLDEADAQLRDEAEGGVAAALIEQETEKPDLSVDYHAMWWKAEREREKAERERDEARNWLRETEASLDEANEVVKSLRAAEPRPLTPDAITDEMVERARQRGSEIVGALWDASVVEAMLTAALTEPPARPEGAEDIEAVLREEWTFSDEDGGEEAFADLAGRLARRGFRVITEERS